MSSGRAIPAETRRESILTSLAVIELQTAGSLSFLPAPGYVQRV